MDNFALRSSFHFKLAMFLKLPSIFFWGVKLFKLENDKSVVLLPYSWRTKNPFKSIYFAAQTGAAELSTGLLILKCLGGRNDISMLVTGAKLAFYKKATTTIKYKCTDGLKLKETLEKLVNEGDNNVITLKSTGYDEMGDVVAEMLIEWSFKKRTK